MANLPDGSGDAYSNLVQGDGTASLAFKMPGTVPLAVSSVVASVDNSAGADTTATLVITDPSGEVIATKRQAAVVDAGAKTTATWALRLDDESGGGGGGVTAQYGRYSATQTVDADDTSRFSFSHVSGDALLDLTFPAFPKVQPGSYWFHAFAVVSSGGLPLTPVTAGSCWTVRIAMNDNYGSLGTVAAGRTPFFARFLSSMAEATMPWVATVPTFVTVAIDHDDGVAGVTSYDFDCGFNVMKIA